MTITGVFFSSLITETQLSSFEPLDLNREDSPDSRELPIEGRMAVRDKQVNTLLLISLGHLFMLLVLCMIEQSPCLRRFWCYSVLTLGATYLRNFFKLSFQHCL